MNALDITFPEIPLDEYGDASLAYRWNVYVDGVLSASAPIQQAEIRHYVEGRKYSVQVSAVNDMGEGDLSDPIEVKMRGKPAKAGQPDVKIVHNVVVVEQEPQSWFAAVVETYDAQGQSSGFGPSDDPTGVFYGRSDLQNGDEWRITTEAPGQTITPLDGGSFIWSGTGQFGWEIRRGGAIFDSGLYTIS